MERIESKLNMRVSKNPLLIYSLDRNINRPLIRNYSETSVINQKMYMINFTTDYNCAKKMITKILKISLNTYFYQSHLLYFYYALLV